MSEAVLSHSARMSRRATVAVGGPNPTEGAQHNRQRHMSVATSSPHFSSASHSSASLSVREHTAGLFPVRRHFGVGIGELLSGAGERGFSLPRILIFMCEYLLGYAEALVADGRLNVEGDLRQLFQVIPDPGILAVVRARFDDGDFYDCQSPECVFRLLKAFVREMPHPLVPFESFGAAMSLIDGQMQWAVQKVRSHPHYRALLASLSDTVAMEIDSWVAAMADGESTGGSSYAISDDGVVDCARPLQGVVRRLALGSHAPLSAVEDFFFSLPKTHRDALEYLGVFAAKMDLTARRTSRSMDLPGHVLCDLATAVAPFIVRPSLWGAASRGEEHRMRARQADFVLLFFHFVKKKHNLLSHSERAALDMPEGDLVASLVATVVPAASQASPGFSPALILRNPTTTQSTQSTPQIGKMGLPSSAQHDRSPASPRGVVGVGGVTAAHLTPGGISRSSSAPGSAGMSRAQSVESLVVGGDVTQGGGSASAASARGGPTLQPKRGGSTRQRRPYFEVWVDALPITPLTLAAPLQSINSCHSRTVARSGNVTTQRRRRLHPFLVGDDDTPATNEQVETAAPSLPQSPFQPQHQQQQQQHSVQSIATTLVTAAPHPPQSTFTVPSHSRVSIDYGLQQREERTTEDLIGDLLESDPERQVRVVFPPRLSDTSVENEGRVIPAWLPLDQRAIYFLKDAPRFLQWLRAPALPCPSSHNTVAGPGASTTYSDVAFRQNIIPPVDLASVLSHPSWDAHTASDSTINGAKGVGNRGGNGSSASASAVLSSAPTRGISALLEGHKGKAAGGVRSARTTSDLNRSAGSRSATFVVAANYDRPLPFPRTTHPEASPHSGALTKGSAADAQRASFARSLDGIWAIGAPTKATFAFDRETDLLNHRPPVKPPTPASRCEHCDSPLSQLGARRYMCAYCGRTLCAACCDRSFVVPGHVLATGEFAPRRVCAACEGHLQAHLYSPLLELDRMTAAAAEQIGRLRVDRIRIDREKITRAIYFCMVPQPQSEAMLPSNVSPFTMQGSRRSFGTSAQQGLGQGSSSGSASGGATKSAGGCADIVPDNSFENFGAYLLRTEGVATEGDAADTGRGCPSLSFMLALLPPRIASLVRQYPGTSGARVSLADVCEMQTRHFADVVDRLRRLFVGHTQRCPYCRVVATARRCCARDKCIWALSRRGSISVDNRTTPTDGDGSHVPRKMSQSPQPTPPAPLAALPFKSYGTAESPVLCRLCLQYSHACCVDKEGRCCATCACVPEERVRVLFDVNNGQHDVRQRSATRLSSVSAPGQISLVSAGSIAPSTPKGAVRHADANPFADSQRDANTGKDSAESAAAQRKAVDSSPLWDGADQSHF